MTIWSQFKGYAAAIRAKSREAVVVGAAEPA